MKVFQNVFGDSKPVIGMIHLKPLPGSPLYGGDMEAIYQAAYEDMQALILGGVNAVMIENFGDIPYPTSHELITYTAFAHLATRLKEICDLPMGINVQFNNYEAEWAIAYSCGFDFIRVEVFAENRMGPNGVCQPCAPAMMRLKGHYPREIALLADVCVKHTFPIVEQPLDFTIEAIIEGGADAIICTGITTGKSPSIENVKEMKQSAKNIPVIVGSGVNEVSIKAFMDVSDGVIVGSSIKRDNNVLNPVDKDKVLRLMKCSS